MSWDRCARHSSIVLAACKTLGLFVFACSETEAFDESKTYPIICDILALVQLAWERFFSTYSTSLKKLQLYVSIYSQACGGIFNTLDDAHGLFLFGSGDTVEQARLGMVDFCYDPRTQQWWWWLSHSVVWFLWHHFDLFKYKTIL